MTIPIFIGYDSYNHEAFTVCCNSIITRSSELVSITPLVKSNISISNEKKGSNEFIYSRFLVPYLMNFKGWAIYLDSDTLLLDDIKKLWILRDNQFSVMVSKHHYKTKFKRKFFNQPNLDYPRKNWSSVVLWNCSKNKHLTSEKINTTSDQYLHRFQWCEEKKIGTLPIEWNWLVLEYEENVKAKLLHYTIGTPNLYTYEESFSKKMWLEEKNKIFYDT